MHKKKGLHSRRHGPPHGHPHGDDAFPVRGRGRGRGGGRRRGRVSRGDVRLAVVLLLNEQPMHGYQIMQELEERSGGAWQPSPGSIYPTLQQLADEGLIVSDAVEGRNVFSLTESGAEVVLDVDGPPPWERIAGEGGAEVANLRRAVHQLGSAARQVGTGGSTEQVGAAYEIINDARKRLYRLLADAE